MIARTSPMHNIVIYTFADRRASAWVTACVCKVAVTTVLCSINFLAVVPDVYNMCIVTWFMPLKTPHTIHLVRPAAIPVHMTSN